MKKTIAELTEEINKADEVRRAAKKTNAIEDDFPKLKRTYTYRDSTKF